MPEAKKQPREKRYSMNINARPQTQEIIISESERTGMDRTELVTRILDWFARQDEGLRAMILGILPESLHVDVARAILEKMAAGEKRK